MVSEDFKGIMVTQDEFESFVYDQHSMKNLTKYRPSRLRPSDVLLDVLCGISSDENFVSVSSAVKR